MNALLAEMKRSLAELDLGLKGDLTISEPMEKLMNSLANDAVPGTPPQNEPNVRNFQGAGEIWPIHPSGHWDRG